MQALRKARTRLVVLVLALVCAGAAAPGGAQAALDCTQSMAETIGTGSGWIDGE
jgi:hypothetical protein